MGEEYLTYFYALKEAIDRQFKAGNPDQHRPIRAWSGKEIEAFQEDLSRVVNGRISEKWFYTHIKPAENQKLPRIDVLNMLSRYVGCDGWEDFVKRQGKKPEKKKAAINSRGRMFPTYGKIGVITGLLLLGVLALFFASNRTYTFCFVDGDTMIAVSEVEVEIIRQGETAEWVTCSSSGCFDWERKGEITFVVHAPYYRADTVIRSLNRDREKEVIKLKTDDYALMIHVFSNARVEDWEKRRSQLDLMINPEAKIFQVSSDNLMGMAMYNKQEFIDKLTMPIKSLGNLKVLETRYLNDQIIYLRFQTTEHP